MQDTTEECRATREGCHCANRRRHGLRVSNSQTFETKFGVHMTLHFLQCNHSTQLQYLWAGMFTWTPCCTHEDEGDFCLNAQLRTKQQAYSYKFARLFCRPSWVTEVLETGLIVRPIWIHPEEKASELLSAVYATVLMLSHRMSTKKSSNKPPRNPCSGRSHRKRQGCPKGLAIDW